MKKHPEQAFKQDLHSSKPSIQKFSLNQCRVCDANFRSLSRFEKICNYCWAENEMRPYYDRASQMISSF